MSDRIPGSNYSNPIWFGKWRIYLGDYTPYQFVHDDYDGADDAYDGRHGFGNSVEDCKDQIREMEA